MSRFTALFLLIVLALPVTAHADTHAVPQLPTAIEKLLNGAAATGSTTLVNATTKTIATLFPQYRAQIAAYSEQIADPATQMMALSAEMAAEPPPILVARPAQHATMRQGHDAGTMDAMIVQAGQ